MKNKYNKGFTLLEVIISISLIGVIGAASLGMFNGYISMEKKAEEYNQKTAKFFSLVADQNFDSGNMSGEYHILNLGDKKAIELYRYVYTDKGNGGEITYYDYLQK